VLWICQIASLATCSIAGLVLAFGAWALIASDGTSDPAWTWSGYVAVMGSATAVAAVAGVVGWLVHRRLLLSEPET
jgi:hypothetical protein